MPASNLKLKNSVRPSPLLAKKAKKNKGKFLKLVKKSPAKPKGLSAAEREMLVLDHRLKARKLARSILRKWHARLDLQEVDSVVDLSLCEAVKRFNPKKGASFMTFLFYHMRGNLIRAVSLAANANSIPVYTSEETNQESDEQVIEPQDFMCRGANAIEVAEALCSHDYPQPDEILLKKEMAELSNDACGKLDTLEKEVIYRIYVQEQQLMDIASTLGYSRCHISRVKKKALETIHGDLQALRKPEDEALPESAVLSEELGTMPERRRVQRRRPRSQKLRVVQGDSGANSESIAAAA